MSIDCVVLHFSLEKTDLCSCYFFQGRLSRSTFPPHNTTATFFRSGSALNFSDNTAATPTAAEGSIKSFIRSQTTLIADMISSSEMVMTSVTLSLMIGQVIWPTLVLNPSAMVSGGPVEMKFVVKSRKWEILKITYHLQEI